MHKLELLLKKYTNNFLVLENIYQEKNIEFLNFQNIVIVTDYNIIKDKLIKILINYLKEKFNKKLILLNSTEPNYKMIESTSKKIVQEKYDLVIIEILD